MNTTETQSGSSLDPLGSAIVCPSCAEPMQQVSERDWECAKCRVHWNMIVGVWFEGKDIKPNTKVSSGDEPR
jgi:hypothetical protein